MLAQQQAVVDNMMKYLETLQDRMREFKRRAGVGIPVRVPFPALPADTAPEPLLKRVPALRTAAEGLAPMECPMELAPYAPPPVNPFLLRDILLFSAGVMLEENVQEKGSGIGTPERDTRAGTVEIDRSSSRAATTFDTGAA